VRVALINLTSGDLSGGYKKYLQHLVPRIAAHPRISQLEILSPHGMKFARSQVATYWAWPSADKLVGYYRLKRRLQYLEPDVVFIPTARIVDTGFPTVVMVRNMEPLVSPFSGNSIADGIKNIGRRSIAWRTCQRATRIIAVSSFVREFLVQKWGIPTGNISIVSHGVEPPLVDSQIAPPPAGIARLEDPWFFAAGSIRPARGLEDAIDAMEILRDRNVACTLLIAGGGDRETRYSRALTDRVARKGLRDRIVWAGELSANDMAWCYSHCAAFLMTSRVEACPNTALEALNYGAVCISTTEPPMPDFFGASAIYYQAGSSEQLVTRMQEVLGLDARTRSQRSVLSRSRAKEFSWEDTAAATVDQLCIAASIR